MASQNAENSALLKELEARFGLELSPEDAVKSFPADSAIITQGDDPLGVHVILHGSVRVDTSFDSGGTTFYPDLHTGDLLGEISCLNRCQATATCVAIDDVETVFIPCRQFRLALEANAETKQELKKIMAERAGRTFMARKAINAAKNDK